MLQIALQKCFFLNGEYFTCFLGRQFHDISGAERNVRNLMTILDEAVGEGEEDYFESTKESENYTPATEWIQQIERIQT